MTSSTWTFNRDTGCWLMAGRGATIYIEPRPFYCNRGNFLAKLDSSAGGINMHDGWPRYYFDLGRAKDECFAWLQKRNLVVPAAATSASPSPTLIDQLWAFITIDPDGNEGVAGARTPEGWLPLIGADMTRVESLRPLARALCAGTKYPIALAHFSSRRDVEVLAHEMARYEQMVVGGGLRRAVGS